jgi:hypothetical protein
VQVHVLHHAEGFPQHQVRRAQTAETDHVCVCVCVCACVGVCVGVCVCVCV